MNLIGEVFGKQATRRANLTGVAAIAVFFCVVAAGAHAQSAAKPQEQSNAPAKLISVPAEVPADAVRFAFQFSGNNAGLMAVWNTPDGARHNFFAFNDRGRGPAILTRMVLDRTGIPTQVDATGNDYYKGQVDEHFHIDGTPARASWSNKAEHGEKKLTAPSFYVPIDATLGSELAAALLSAPGGRLELLPEGEARIERVLERAVDVGGEKQTVTLYEISGLSFTSYPLWLDADRNLFASGSDWAVLIREGAAAAWPALLEAQKARAAVRGKEVARKLSQRYSQGILIENARLFDSETKRVRDGMSVLVKGNRIEAVAPTASLQPKGKPEVIDARGKMLLPGLWDMHVHMGDWDDGLLHLAAGVTTVRDMANDIEHLDELQKKFDQGTLIGPRIVRAGFIDGRGPYQGPTKVFADTKEEALADIEKYKSLGYEQIKVYSSLKPELVPYIAAEAHARGMRLSGHVPAFMTAEQFVNGGADEIQHMNFIFLNFFFDQVQDTRTPARFTSVAERGAELDLNSDRVRAFVRLLHDHHTVLDPTVSVFEEMFVSRRGTMAPGLAEVASRLPAQIRRGGLTGGLPIPEGKGQRYLDSFQAMLHMLKLLHDSGITIVAGTDSIAGFTLHRELENYVAVGIPAPDVLQIATLGGARVMKHDGERGSIAPGKLADLILVNGDPAARISDIRRVVTVIKDGTVYDAAAVYAALGVLPAQ